MRSRCTSYPLPFPEMGSFFHRQKRSKRGSSSSFLINHQICHLFTKILLTNGMRRRIMFSNQRHKCNDWNKYTQETVQRVGVIGWKPLSKSTVMECLQEQDDWTDSRSSRLPPLWVLSGSLRTAIRVEPRTIVSVWRGLFFIHFSDYRRALSHVQITSQRHSRH